MNEGIIDKAIRVEGLKKQYGKSTVLKGVSFDVQAGEIFALLGTNGAGKTTTLACIEGLRTYDGGEITIIGKIGVQLQSSSLPSDIKVKEAVKLFSKWSRSSIPTELAKRLGLNEIGNKVYKSLSTGQKQRLHLVLSIIGNPDIVILDEPTAGLDVEGRAALHDEIRELKNAGKTVLLASHDMAEVETLCDHIAILHDGSIVFYGTAAELITKDMGPTQVKIRTSGTYPIEKPKTASFVQRVQDYCIFTVGNIGDGLLELLTIANKHNLQVLDIQILHASLEQRFLELAKGELI